jgi:glycosyltransferase involved in cell wall biosynthesis
MSASIDITIIIPFLNEEENINRLAVNLLEFTKKNCQISFEIILVNDGSTDHSVSKIQDSIFPQNTKLINLSQNFGSHAALRSGILHAKGNYVTFLYADLQDPINNISRMFEKVKLGNEIIWAFRSGTKNSFIEKKFSNFYSMLMKRYVNNKYPDKGFDVVMFSNKVTIQLNKNIESNSSIFLQILNLGFKQNFIEYQKELRTSGKSKWTISKKIKLFIDSFVAFSYVPIKLVSLIGIMFFLIGLSLTIYFIGRKLIYNDLLTGWPQIMSILLLGFGITNISLGIIAEYLWRTLDASRKRPVFIIDEIIELNNNG